MSRVRVAGPLTVEVLTTGANAHGYGQLADERTFAFRVRNGKARLEIYRAGADAAEPAPHDIDAVAERSTGAMNLDSQRSLTGLLPMLAAMAEPTYEYPERTLRAYFGRLDSLLERWTQADPNADADTVAGLPAPGPKRERTLRGYLHRLFADAA